MNIEMIKNGMIVTPKTVLSAPDRFGLSGEFCKAEIYIKGTQLKVLGFKRDTFGPPVKVQLRDELPFQAWFSEITNIENVRQ